ncbi:MAG: 6-hydroxymethylpterin diphosphokinase MptE-like protein [Thermoplasmataceae archaeon]
MTFSGNDWTSHYAEICEVLKIDSEKDIESSTELKGYKNCGEGLLDLAKSHSGKKFFVIGNGREKDSIEDIWGNGTVIVADSAISKIPDPYVPEIIVTDLDGDIPRIIEMSGKGSIVFIHSHGDNIQRIREFCPKFKGRFVPTTQVPDFEGMMNFEGFTDGDRSAYIADYLGASSIELIDFDFSEQNGKPWNRNKEIKLKIARDLLIELEKIRGDRIIGL